MRRDRQPKLKVPEIDEGAGSQQAIQPEDAIRGKSVIHGSHLDLKAGQPQRSCSTNPYQGGCRGAGGCALGRSGSPRHRPATLLPEAIGEGGAGGCQPMSCGSSPGTTYRRNGSMEPLVLCPRLTSRSRYPSEREYFDDLRPRPFPVRTIRPVAAIQRRVTETCRASTVQPRRPAKRRLISVAISRGPKVS